MACKSLGIFFIGYFLIPLFLFTFAPVTKVNKPRYSKKLFIQNLIRLKCVIRFTFKKDTYVTIRSAIQRRP